MDIFEKIKKGVNQKTIWINTDGTGLMIAELFEKANIPINRFALSAKQFQPTRLNCGLHFLSQYPKQDGG